MSTRAFQPLNDRAAASTLLVLFGDQLSKSAGPLRSLDRSRDAILMMEVDEESTHVPSHKQRTALFLSAMRHFAQELAEDGFRVRYVEITDPHNTHSLSGEIERACRILAPDRLAFIHPGERRVLDIIESLRERLSIPAIIHEDEHFLCTIDGFQEWASGRKALVMEHFYRRERRRLNILMDQDGQPAGGRWNFDKDNRAAFRRAPRPPAPYMPRPDAVTREVIDLVARRFERNPGSLASFRWPVKRAEAKRALDDFITNRLARFGDHQDAMWTGQPFLYHALLSPAMNLKLLDPREVYGAAIDAHERSEAPINAVEGFVRQVIGWREFMRGVYWTQGRDYASRNHLRQKGSLPDLYWTGETDMACMRECVGQVLDNAFGHHIQRLMVTGAFALIAGVQPREVSDWYLGMYADAVDWVTLPNTLGMSQFADGGVVATKPYAASGRYISRMSNYCAGCRFDPSQRTGERACPFTTFYWDFLIRQRDRLRPNHRMAMILKNVDALPEPERVEITVSARRLRRSLGIRAA